METVGNIFSKIINFLYWSYFWLGFGLWIYFLYETIRDAQYIPTQLVYLVSTFFGLGALLSYLDKTKVGNKGFWRGILFLIPLFFLTATNSWFVTLMYLLPMLPFLYAIYRLGFDNGLYELLCLLKKERLYKFDKEVREYKKSETFINLSPFKQKMRSFELFAQRP